MTKKKIIHFIQSYPRFLILAFTLMIVFFAFGIPKLQKEYSQKSWFRAHDPILKSFNAFKKEYGSDISLITVLSFKSSVFEIQNMRRVYQITEDFWQIPGFTRINSLSNYSHTFAKGDEIVIAPLIDKPESWGPGYLTKQAKLIDTIKPVQNYLISDDRKTVAIYSSFKHKEGGESELFKQTVAKVKKQIVSKYQAEDLKIMLTGPAVVGTTFEEESFSDFLFLIPSAFILLFVILTLILRNMIATVLTLGLIAITLISMLGIQGWLGIKVGLVTGMCPLIVLAICVADAIHIFSSYLQGQANGEKNPLAFSLNKNLYPTFLTSVTTILGFIALMGAELYPIADMGIVSAIGIGLAWIYTIFILCPMLKLIPIKANLMVKRRENFINFTKVHSLISKHSKAIVIGTVLITLTSFYFSSQNTVDSNMLNYFDQKTDFRKATDFFEKNIGGTQSIELIINSGESEGVKSPVFLNKVDDFIQEVYLQIQGVSKVSSILDPLKEVNHIMHNGKEAHYNIPKTTQQVAQELFFLELSLPPEKNLNNLLSDDKKDMRISIYWKRTNSSEIMQGTKDIQALLKKSGLNGQVTGTVPLISGLDGYIVSSFVKSMITAIVLISILMMFVFKSFWYGLFSMVPNIIVPSFGATILYATGKSFDVGSILIFSICLGIAIDDTIFFLTNLQSARKKHKDLSLALKEVLETTGQTLTYTTLILVCIFGLFYLGSFIPNQNFALATTVILTTALVLDLVFLPSLLIQADKFKKRFA